MWGTMASSRPSKNTMVQFLLENQVELPETASISQIRTAFNALAGIVPDGDIDEANQAGGLAITTSGDDHVEGEPPEEHFSDVQAPKSEEKRGGSQEDGVAQCVASYQEREKLIERELELARVKLDTLRLEIQLRAGRPEERPKDRQKIRLQDVERIVKEFGGSRGENVKKWLNLLSSTVMSYGGAEDDCYRIARALLIGVARERANKALWTDWNSLRAGLLDECKDRRSAMDVYDELRRRVRRAGETSEEYVLAMEVIANDEVAEIDLIPMVIVGLGGNAPFAAMLAGATTIRELQGLLPAYDRIVKLTAGTRSIAAQNSGGADVAQTRRRSCYNCKSEDHIAAHCPRPQLRKPFSCFECGSSDHQLKACPKRQVAAIVEGDVVEPFDNVSAIFTSVTGSTKTDIKILFDSGSPISLIEEQFIPKQHFDRSAELKEFGYNALGNSTLKSFGKIHFDVIRSSKIIPISAFVVENATLPCGLLLGRDSMEKFGIKLIEVDSVTPSDCLPDLDNWNVLPEDGIISAAFDVEPKLSLKMQEQINDVILENYTNYAGEKKTIDYEMRIVVENAAPIFSRPRRLSYAEKNKLRDIINGLVKEGIIRPSSSEYASPIVLVKKKSGDLRMCVDYRALNKITKRDNYPIPLIDDCIDYLANKKIFSLLDLKSGFHQVKVNEDSIKFTSFVTPDGQWEYTKMPFGLKNAPSVFQRYINKIFRDFIDKGLIMIYLDDILIATQTMEDHIELLTQLLNRLSEFGLELQLNKCKFAFNEIEYLGFIASKEGIRPGTEKTKAIEKFPVPRNAKEVHSFIGLCGYFRRFAKSFSTIASPLQNLIKPGVPFNFDASCEIAFEELKKILMNPPTLAIYDPRKETELHTDASAIGFGAVLLQKQPDNKWHPVAYYSRATSDTEKELHSYVLETLAIYYALERYRIYLEGIDFTVVTDCNSLVQAINKKDINRSIGKWICEFMNYNFTVKHRNGVNMGHVDALSRMPMIAAVDPTDIDVQLIALQSVDPVVSDLKIKLQQKSLPLFELSDGIVYKKGREGDLRFYVPKDLEVEIIRTIHEKCGHFGIGKTFDYLKKHYWFPEMKTCVDKFIKNCIKCIIYSAPTKKNETQLYSIPKSPIPFDTLHVDHFGPLPSITSKKKHILVITDAFTKHVKLYPVNATSAKEVVCALEKYFEYYDRPRRIISDRGSCFTSGEFSTFLNKLNIVHVKVATCAPQANGQVERVNRVIKAMLGKITNPVDNSDWVKRLKEVQFAINNTVSRSTGASPNMLLFGVEQKGPIVDYLTEFLSGVKDTPRVDLEEIRKEADVNIKKSQDYASKWFNENSKGAKNYLAGDLVYILNVDTTPGNKKFIPKFKGPYTVVKVLPNDRYVIGDVEGMQVSQIPYDGVIEARNIRLWKRIENNTINMDQ